MGKVKGLEKPGREGSVCKSSSSQSGDPGLNPGVGLGSGHPMHE